MGLSSRRNFMRRVFFAIGPILLASSVYAASVAVAPPVAEKKPHYTVTNGDSLLDNYFWMREKTSPEVVKYLEDENKYADSVMDPTKPLQETLYNEMLGRIKETDENVPYKKGGYYYYSRTEQGKQYAIQCRRKGSLTAAEEVILDLNEMARGHAFISIGDMEISDDGNFCAFSTDTTGFRQYNLAVKDLRSGEMLPDSAPRVTSIVWAADNSTIFYVQEDPVSKRSFQAFRHTLRGTTDEMIYEEKDELYDIYMTRTRSNAYIIMGATSSTTSEMWYLDAKKPTDK